MDSRYELHEILCNLLGSRHVYYQPPANRQMSYPAIVYSRSDIQNELANNGKYIRNHRYTVIVIDENPDSELVEQMSKLPLCSFDRHYTKDNLNHDVFTLFYK